MREPRSSLAKLALSVLALHALACGGTTTGGVYRTPIVERGVCATILMPGQTVPMPEPGETPGCQGGHTSIAGGGVIEEGQKTTKTETHPVVKAITAPFAILLFPFKLMMVGAEKLGDVVSPDDEVPLDPRLRGKQAEVAKVDPQAKHEQEQLSALEEELAQRGGRTQGSQSGPALETKSGPTLPPQGGAAAPPAPRRSSIADELAALRGVPPVPVPVPQSAAGDAGSAPPVRATPAPVAAAPRAAADRVLDRDADGRPDQWVYLSQGRPAREEYDDNGDGAPDRSVLLDPASGAQQRVEEDRDGDGRPDSITEYKNGEIVRIRRDTNLDGAPDAWSFYQAGQLSREEQDPDGDGFRNRVALYQGGRLTLEREDRDGDGRIDRLTRYDAEERVLQRDEDQDGDGLVDARAFYEEGRLVRRELVNEAAGDGLEDEEDLTSAEWSSEPPSVQR